MSTTVRDDGGTAILAPFGGLDAARRALRADQPVRGTAL
jgi:hypothetical protein